MSELRKNVDSGPVSPEPQEERNENMEVIAEIKEWAKKTIEEWHDRVAPDYIFVTETAGVPYGFVLKETWKNAYPDEECPAFYRIDPKSKPPEGVSEEKIQAGLDKYFDRRIKKDGARVIVFDEGPGRPLELADQHFKKDERYYKRSSLRKAVDLVKSGFDIVGNEASEIWAVSGRPENENDYKASQMLFGFDKTEINGVYDAKRPTSKKFGLLRYYPFSSERDKTADEAAVTPEKLKEIAEDENYTLAGGIVKNMDQKIRAMKFIAKLKQIGAEAGQEMRDRRININL